MHTGLDHQEKHSLIGRFSGPWRIERAPHIPLRLRGCSGVPMVHSNRRLHHRMKSVCRLPACLAWPHGLFGSWLFCICALLGFFEFLYHLSSCGAKTMNAHGVFSLKIQSHTKPAHSDCRGQIPVPGYIRRKSFSHFCEETGRAQQQCIWEAAQGRREGKTQHHLD